MGPKNHSGQPMELARELKRQGINVTFIQYLEHPFGYEADREILYTRQTRAEVMMDTLKQLIEEDYDIYHLWWRPLLFTGPYTDYQGLDIPLIKCRGKRIVYRFTGNDLRYQSVHKKVDPYSFFKYGYTVPWEESVQRKHNDFLTEYVDEFIVQDPEMHGYFPRAKVIPRGIDLSKYEHVGIDKNKAKPLVVHIPSIPEIKGTAIIKKAVDELKREGLNFEFYTSSRISHKQTMEWFKKADIMVDELHKGWYGIAALECMAMGKPVLTYIRHDLTNSLGEEIPVLNVNPDNIKEQLRKIIRDKELRWELSRKGRPFVKKHHCIKKVAADLAALYKEVYKRPSKMPTGTKDIEYFKIHYIETFKKNAEILQLKQQISALKREIRRLRRQRR